MTKEELKQYIDDNIYENQDGEITGEALNEVLKAIVDDGGTEVEANPAGEATETLGKLKIGKTIYTAPQGPQGEPGEDGQDGQPGAPGPANKLIIGTVTDGEQAAASITGEAPNQQLNLVLPKGEQGDPGQNAVNPFKGIYGSDNKPTGTFASGDYIYAPTSASGQTGNTIWKWNGTTWQDSGETPDIANAETFASSETLQQVAIDDSHLANPTNSADSTKPVLAKAEDVMQLKAKLEGVTASEEKAINYPVANGYIACRNYSTTRVAGHYYTDTSRRTTFITLNDSKSVRFLGLKVRNTDYIVGYAYLNIDGSIDDFISSLSNGNDLSSYIIGGVKPFEVDSNLTSQNPTELDEITSIIPEGANYVALFFDSNTSSNYKVKDTNFYCYLQSGTSVVEMIPEVDQTQLGNPNINSVAKAEDAVQLKVKLGGVSAEVEKLVNYTPVKGKYDGYGNEEISQVWYRTEVPIPEGTRNIRFLGVKIKYSLSDAAKDVGYAVGHYEEGAFVVDYRRRFEENTDENEAVAKEYSIDITSQNNELYFRTEVQYGVILNKSNFYCYFTKGENVGDIEKRLSDKPLISRIKMLPAVKELGLSLVAAGQRFVSSETTRTWFAFLKAGEKIIVSNSFSVSTYVCVGTASIDEPPHIVEAGGSMDAFPKLEKGSVIGDYSYEFTAPENCYFWITYRFAQGDPTFVKICNFEEKKPSLLLGSPSLHWSEFTETDENISSKTAADVYAIYDELAISHSLWLKRVNDIGHTTLDSNLEIRHYVLGYQKATLQSTYAGENILYDDNGVNHDMPHIVISAGIHGDEKASVWGVAKACKEIIESNEPWAVFIKANFVIDIIPIVSPYTFNRNVRNMTVDGVSIDPNRDYSTFTLNESRAMRDFMLQTKAVCFIDCHNTKNSDTKERMFLSSQEGSINAEAANHLCMRLSSLMSMLIPESYPYPEDPKVFFLLSKATIAKTTTLAYFIGEMNEILSFTMESPRNNIYDNPTNDCTLKASVLMTTLIENVIPALSELSV